MARPLSSCQGNVGQTRLLLWLGVLTAVATVVPQAPNVPSTVERWLSGEEGPLVVVSQVLLVTGAFGVYGSAVFLALLLALYLSLTACLIPRIRAWLRLVRCSQPPLLRVAGGATGDFVAEGRTDELADRVLSVAREVPCERIAGVARWSV